METKNTKLDDNKLEITVTLSVEEVQKEIDAAYKQAGKNRIPGFRPGKAPRKILENHFGGKEYFQAQATDELIQRFTPLAADAADTVALSNPDFSEFDLAVEGEPFVFTFTIEATPELELDSYEPVKIELPSAEPTEEEMQMQIDALLSYNALPDEEGNVQTPELTDAWVKETLEFENVDEFKERLADSIREQKGQDIPTLREIRSTQELAKRLVGEVPESLILQTEQDNYRDLFQSLQKQRMTLDAYMETYGYTSETFRESMHQQAHDSAAMSLALDAVARHEGFEVTDEEIVEEFERSSAPDPKKLLEDWKRNGRLSEIRQGIRRMKAAQHIYDNAEIFDIGELHPVETDDKDAKQKPAKKESTKKAAAKKDETKETAASEKKPADKPAKKSTSKTSTKTSAASDKKTTAKKTTAKSQDKPAKEATSKSAKKADDTAEN